MTIVFSNLGNGTRRRITKFTIISPSISDPLRGSAAALLLRINPGSGSGRVRNGENCGGQ